MGIPVLVIGKSGSGKSSSMRAFSPNDIGLVNVSRKPLPFKGGFQSTLMTDDYDKIETYLRGEAPDSIVIDDGGYLIVNMFMRGHSKTGSGNAIFGFYNQIADCFWNLIETVKELPAEKIVYIMMHEEVGEYGAVKPKTIGKLLDAQVCIEGMFTICLRTQRHKQHGYCFETQSDDFGVSKAPFGMFRTVLIPNDLKFVDGKIREYYKI